MSGTHTTPENIEKLRPDEVFVFGSNLAGNHAGGAAKQAHDQFGAVMGVGEGLTGQCYAFPTLNADMSKIDLYTLCSITDAFYRCVNAHPDRTFLLTKVGCGIAGYSEDAMKNLLAPSRPNLVKPEGW